jgi:hypothetical protein
MKKKSKKFRKKEFIVLLFVGFIVVAFLTGCQTLEDQLHKAQMYYLKNYPDVFYSEPVPQATVEEITIVG